MISEKDIEDWDKLETPKVKEIVKKIYEYKPISNNECATLEYFVNAIEHIQKSSNKQVAAILRPYVDQEYDGVYRK